MSDIYVEAQYDPRCRLQLLQASTGFGDPNPYRVTLTDVSAEEGYQGLQEFVLMYRRLGSTVHANGREGRTLVLGPLLEPVCTD